MSFTPPFLLGPVFFGPPFRGLVIITSSERGEVPLLDSVGINRKKGATTENPGAGVEYMD